jgi:hypothetical protein
MRTHNRAVRLFVAIVAISAAALGLAGCKTECPPNGCPTGSLRLLNFGQ